MESFQDFSEKIRLLRYALTPTETREEGYIRQATFAASAELPEKRDLVRDDFISLLTSEDFISGGRIQYAAGRDKPQAMNCYALDVEDSRESLGQLFQEVMVISSTGGGVGINFSKLRPEGDPIKSIGGLASGPVSWAYVVDRIGEVIKSGGSRRAAFMGILSVSHPDIEKFINAKVSRSYLTNMNISVLINNDFVEAVKKDKLWRLTFRGRLYKEIKARELWQLIITNAIQHGEPGILNEDNIRAGNNSEYFIPFAATNPCLSKQSRVFVRNGLSTIDNLVGKGTETVLAKDRYGQDIYSDTTGAGFFETEEEADVYRLITKEGYFLDLTKNHPVAVVEETGINYLPAEDLIKGQKIPTATIQVPKINKKSRDFSVGYIVGNCVGDGYIDDEKPHICLWPEYNTPQVEYIETCCSMMLNAKVGFGSPAKADGKIQISRKGLMEYFSELEIGKSNKYNLSRVLSSSKDLQAGYISGIFDADGSPQGTHNKGCSVRLASIKESFLQEIQLMLLGLGIHSSIYFRREACTRLLPSSEKHEYKLYPCQKLYELVISNTSMKIFAQVIGFKDSRKQERVESFIKTLKRKVNKDRNYATFDRLEYQGKQAVYDATVPETSNFFANGLLVHNCSESILGSGMACVLGSVNLDHMYKESSAGIKIDWAKYKETIRRSVRLLDNIITVNSYPLQKNKQAMDKTRQIGLGVVGFHHLLIRLGISYGNNARCLEVSEQLAKVLRDESYRASIELAREKGPFEGYDAEKYLQNHNVKRLPASIRRDILEYGVRNCSLNAIAPTGTLSIIARTSSSIEPIFAAAYERRYYKDNVLTESAIVVDPLIAELIKQDKPLKHIKPSYELSLEDHLSVLAAWTDYVDQSVSKTQNVPEDFTDTQTSNLVLKYLPLIKGLTIYKIGSRENQPLTPLELTPELIESIKNDGYEQGLREDKCRNGVCDL